MNIIEGLKPWEVMKAYEEDGKRVAYRMIPNEEWHDAPTPVWDWRRKNYAIIDDTAPVIDWDGFNWEFFNQYGGVLIKPDDSGLPSPTSVNHALPVGFDVQLREAPFYPWFGGECPVPGNAEVEVVFMVLTRGIGGVMRNYITGRADAINWADQNLIAFRLTGGVLP